MDKRVEEIESLLKDIGCATSGLSEVLDLGLGIPDLRKVYKALEKKQASLYKELNKLKKKCSHNWKYGGHGHNDDWYVCTICGETEDR